MSMLCEFVSLTTDNIFLNHMDTLGVEPGTFKTLMIRLAIRLNKRAWHSHEESWDTTD